MFKKVKAEAPSELEYKNRELEDQIRSLNHQIASYKNRVSQLEAIEEGCIPAIDFKAMQAFSVERNLTKDGRYITIIGYYNTKKEDKSLGEWYIYCSAKRHDELAHEFKEYIKNENRTN